MTSSVNAPFLQMKGISKRFAGVAANVSVDFDVSVGEVHALMGDDGAGKSTLMNILAGIYTADEGEMFINGQSRSFRSPSEALASGVSLLSRGMQLVPTLTVLENIMLGLKRRSKGRFSQVHVRRRVNEIADVYRLPVQLDAYPWQVTVGECQRVAIIKALMRESLLLVLDEPTYLLTPSEANDLFVTLRRVSHDGCGIILISNKLHEVLALADRITVMRDGKITGSAVVADSDIQDLERIGLGQSGGDGDAGVGDKPSSHLAKLDFTAGFAGDVCLRVKDLHVVGDQGLAAVKGVSLSVRSGSILGVTGIPGNGQNELIESIVGLRPVSSGVISINGVDITGFVPAQTRSAGLAFMPEDRERHGVIAGCSVQDNLILHSFTKPSLSRYGLLRMKRIREHCKRLLEEHDMSSVDLLSEVVSLSNGVIQKLIMARETSETPRVLIVSQPVKGTQDLGLNAAQKIHECIRMQRDLGVAVLLISEDASELIALSDDIAVMRAGRIVDVLTSSDSTVEQIEKLTAAET